MIDSITGNEKRRLSNGFYMAGNGRNVRKIEKP